MKPVGRFALIEHLGSGLRFEVFRARLSGVLGFEKDVVLKRPTDAVMAEPARRAALIEGMKRATVLTAASVVKVLDLGEDDGRPFFVTELARGRHLKTIVDEFVAAGRRVPASAVMTLGAEIAQSVDDAHRKGIVHGGLELKKVHVSDQGDLKVRDFGLAGKTHRVADLVALGQILRGLSEIVEGGLPPEALALTEELVGGRHDDAGAVAELLLELGWRGPDDVRDLQAFVRPAVPTDLAPFLDLSQDFEATAQIDANMGAFLVLVVPRKDLREVTSFGQAMASSDPSLALFTTPAEARTQIEDRLMALYEKMRQNPDFLAFVDYANFPIEGDGTPLWSPLRDEVAAKGSAILGRTRRSAGVAVSSKVATKVRASFLFESSGDDHRWVVERRRSTPGAARFVGGTRSLSEIAAALAKAMTEGASILSVSGPHGIGKSRLCQEFVSRVPSDRLASLSLTCLPDDARVSGRFLLRLLQHVLMGAAHPEPSQESLLTQLRSLGLPQGALASACHLFGIRAEVHRGLGEKPQSAHEALASVLDAFRMGRPMLLTIDDADHLDPMSQSLLFALVKSENAKRLPLVVALIEESPTSSIASQTLLVEELSDHEVAEVLADRLGARLIPPELFEFVAERASGHPLLLEDLIRDLLDGAHVEVRGGVAQLIGKPHLEPKKQRLVRFEGLRRGLPEAAQRALFAVASAGRAVGVSSLGEILEVSDHSLAEALGHLEARALVRRDELGQVYAASLYASVLREVPGADRVRRGLGLWLSVLGAHLAAAEHLRSSGESALAAAQYRLASESLLGEGNEHGALAALCLGLSELPNAEEARSALARFGRLSRACGLVEMDLEELLVDALFLIDRELDRDARVAIRAELAAPIAAGGALATAQVLFGQAEEIAGEMTEVLARYRLEVAAETSDPRMAGDGLLWLAEAPKSPIDVLQDGVETALLAGSFQLAETFLGRISEQEVEQEMTWQQRTRTFCLEGMRAWWSGSPKSAVKFSERALELSPELGKEASEVRAALLFCRLFRAEGDRPRALSLAQLAERLARKGSHFGLERQARLEIDLIEERPGFRASLAERSARFYSEGLDLLGFWVDHARLALGDITGEELRERCERAGLAGLVGVIGSQRPETDPKR